MDSSHSALPSQAPRQKAWPLEDLESLAHCPVCTEAQRQLLHSDLVDNTFLAAPGKWTLWQCTKCRSAYLDPRPTQATIHRAYASYYTHKKATSKEGYDSLTRFRKLRRRLVNGYTNWRFGTRATPSSKFGVLAAYAVPRLKKMLDREYRHLPRLPKGGGRLLDVGCGDGLFLCRARDCGWDAIGLDPDPQAVANAVSHGLTVYEGDIEYFTGQSELFDVITLSHVIEHVFDPVKMLAQCWTLLKPGGQVWIETPNINSFGYARFQADWRGLEAPRHLVLLNRYSMDHVLRRAGFLAPGDRGRQSACSDMFRASLSIQRGSGLNADVLIPWSLRLQLSIAVFAEKFCPRRREFLTVAAEKAVR